MALRDRLGTAGDIDLTEARVPLLDELEHWRSGAAAAAAVSPTAVLSDAALRTLAREQPCSLDALAAVVGVGPGKARRFGPRLLEIICPD